MNKRISAYKWRLLEAIHEINNAIKRLFFIGMLSIFSVGREFRRLVDHCIRNFIRVFSRPGQFVIDRILQFFLIDSFARDVSCAGNAVMDFRSHRKLKLK
jgi:hypothetical protein